MGDNRAPDIIVALAVLYTLAFVFTLLRVYVRIYVSKNWGADDYVLVATLVSKHCVTDQS
jgi:hypothetical protein